MPYVGFWKRTLLLEPKSNPDEKESNIDVQWIQSKSGLFIDLRIPKHVHHSQLLQQSKSFSGLSCFDSNTSILCWNRVLDFRAIPAEDAGVITDLDKNIIQEDSVLEGDDYREIWERIDENDTKEQCDIACYLYSSSSPEDSQARTLLGYFIQINNKYALSLNFRDDDNNNKTSSPSIDSLKQYFQCDQDLGSIESEQIESYLQKYLTCFGCTEDWKITHSLNPAHVGSCLDSVVIEHFSSSLSLIDVLKALQWEVACGSLPSFIATTKN